MNEMTRRPAIYARVSTEEQAQSGTSLRTQIDSLRADLMSERKAPARLFVDDGYSGATPNRPGLIDLESAIAAEEISEVRVTALDRLSRDLVLQETLLSRWARQGVPFISQREPDLGENDPTRVLIRQVLGAISQYERAVIAGRMLAGRIARARQGFWPGGSAPYGLVLEGQPPKAVIDQEAAEFVREAGLRVLAGERAVQIAEDFNERGILGPGGNGWDGSYLSRMLRNPVYKGEARYRVREFDEAKSRRSVHHAAEDTKNSSRIRPEDEWVIFEVPAIFSDSQWAAIQTELGKRGMPKRDAANYLLSRRFESACGAMYHGNRNNGKPRYLCSRRINRKYRGDEDCGCSQVSAPMVDEAVWRGVAEILLEPERLATLAQQELRRGGLEQSEAHIKRQLQSLDRKILSAREALNRLVRYHAEKGTLGEEGFESAAASIRNEIEFLTYDRNKLMVIVPGRRLAQDQRAIAKIASEASKRLEELSFEEKQRLLALLDVRVKVDEHGHPEVRYRRRKSRVKGK